jgi:hypothetical protein
MRLRAWKCLRLQLHSGGSAPRLRLLPNTHHRRESVLTVPTGFIQTEFGPGSVSALPGWHVSNWGWRPELYCLPRRIHDCTGMSPDVCVVDRTFDLIPGPTSSHTLRTTCFPGSNTAKISTCVFGLVCSSKHVPTLDDTRTTPDTPNRARKPYIPTHFSSLPTHAITPTQVSHT